MFLQKNIFLLIISMCLFTQLHTSQNPQQQNQQPDDQQQNQPKPTWQDKFHESQIKRNDLLNKLDEEKNSISHETASAGVQVLAKVAGDQIGNGINYGIRWLSGDLAEEQQLLEQKKQYDKEIQALNVEQGKKQIEHLNSQTTTQKTQDKQLNGQLIREKIEVLTSMCNRGVFDNEKCTRESKELWDQLEALYGKKDNNTTENNTTPSNNNSSESSNNDPKSNNNQNQKNDQNKPKEEGFFKTLAGYSLFVATAAGTMADSIADYSFEYVTGLEQLKDTFIGKYKKGINRALVAVTLYAILHKSYSLYKAYQAEKNATEDDIFNDDDED